MRNAISSPATREPPAKRDWSRMCVTFRDIARPPVQMIASVFTGSGVGTGVMRPRETVLPLTLRRPRRDSNEFLNSRSVRA